MEKRKPEKLIPVTATIVDIQPTKEAHLYKGLEFRRVIFEVHNHGYGITDLVPGFDNYPRWQQFLLKGMVLTNLYFDPDAKKIDADSHPEFVRQLKNIPKPQPPPHRPKEKDQPPPDPQLPLL